MVPLKFKEFKSREKKLYALSITTIIVVLVLLYVSRWGLLTSSTGCLFGSRTFLGDYEIPSSSLLGRDHYDDDDEIDREMGEETETPLLPLPLDPSTVENLGPFSMAVYLRSRNRWGLPWAIKWWKEEPRGHGERGGYNPAVISLPKNSKFRYLAVVRNDPYLEPFVRKGKEYARSIILWCFLEEATDIMGFDYFECEGEVKELDLPPPWPVVEVRTENITEIPSDYNRDWWTMQLGPRDPRIFWTPRGVPILLYTQTSAVLKEIRTMWVADLRLLIPELSDVLPEAYRSDKVPFAMNRTELVSPDFKMVEKNYIPFFTEEIRSEAAAVSADDAHGSTSDDASAAVVDENLHKKVHGQDLREDYHNLYFITELMPLKVYRYGGEERNAVSLNRVEQQQQQQEEKQNKKAEGCYDQFVKYLKRKCIHGGTNSLKMTLCRRGECDPTVSNTVHFALFHVLRPDHERDFGRWYERYALTWNTTMFEPISISPPLLFDGLGVRDGIVFDISMHYNRHQLPRVSATTNSKETTSNTIEIERDESSSDHEGAGAGGGVKEGAVEDMQHGFLDDEIMVGIGVDNNRAQIALVKAMGFFHRHKVCNNSASWQAQHVLRQLSRPAKHI